MLEESLIDLEKATQPNRRLEQDYEFCSLFSSFSGTFFPIPPFSPIQSITSHHSCAAGEMLFLGQAYFLVWVFIPIVVFD